MTVFFFIAFIFFLALYALIGFRLFRSEQRPKKLIFMSSCAVGLFFCMACVFVATVIVEMNESYWWYGPAERMNWLAGITALFAFSGLIIGPILGYRFTHRRKEG